MNIDTKQFINQMSDESLYMLKSEIESVLSQRESDRKKSPEAFIEDVGIGIRALNILQNMGVKKISDLQYYTRQQLGMQRNWGKICFKQLEKAMESHSVKFKSN